MVKRTYNIGNAYNNKEVESSRYTEFRTISLIPDMSKIVFNIIRKRIEYQIELLNPQFGFRKNISTRNTIGALIIMMGQNRALYYIYMLYILRKSFRQN